MRDHHRIRSCEYSIRRHTATKTIIAARGVSTRQGGGATQKDLTEFGSAMRMRVEVCIHY